MYLSEGLKHAMNCLMVATKLFQKIQEYEGSCGSIWVNVNRIVQRMKYSGGTFSGYKSLLCAAEIVVVGHLCTFEGRKAYAG